MHTDRYSESESLLGSSKVNSSTNSSPGLLSKAINWLGRQINQQSLDVSVRAVVVLEHEKRARDILVCFKEKNTQKIFTTPNKAFLFRIASDEKKIFVPAGGECYTAEVDGIKYNFNIYVENGKSIPKLTIRKGGDCPELQGIIGKKRISSKKDIANVTGDYKGQPIMDL